MSSYTQIYYHIIFSTKERKSVLSPHNHEPLFNYIVGFLKNKKCHPYRINAVEDHIHIFTSIHKTLAPANLIRDLKTSAHDWIDLHNIFPGFTNWQVGYGAFTKSHSDKYKIIEYVRNQKEHHKTETFRDEFIRLLNEEGVEFEEKYLD